MRDVSEIQPKPKSRNKVKDSLSRMTRFRKPKPRRPLPCHSQWSTQEDNLGKMFVQRYPRSFDPHSASKALEEALKRAKPRTFSIWHRPRTRLPGKIIDAEEFPLDAAAPGFQDLEVLR
jgi:hypothetical protein